MITLTEISFSTFLGGVVLGRGGGRGFVMHINGEILNVDKWQSNWFFHSTRGLRQGDPLSPLLLVIVMEALNRMTSALVNNGFVDGFSIRTPDRGIINISHLFADDTLIFCEADQNQIRALKALLLCLEAASRLKVNFDKSEMVPNGGVLNLRQLALGCKIASLPMTYLGLPLGAPSRASSLWDTVVEKVERRLAGWKKMYLSKGSRIMLIKSTLSNLSTYFLSLFPTLANVAVRIEKLQRDFLWSGMGEEFQFHLVK